MKALAEWSICRVLGVGASRLARPGLDASDDPFRLDGNSAAGLLWEVFAVEMTTASCSCAVCGRVSAVGALQLYGGAMGSVLRCPSCEALVLCVTSGPAGHFIELRGVMHIHPSGADEGSAQ